MKRKTVILLILLVLVIIFVRSCVIPFVRHFNETDLSKVERTSKLKNAQDEYKTIFKEDVWKDFSYNDNYVDKSQNPILTFVYKQDRKMKGRDYEVVMQKVSMTSTLSLDKFVILKKGETNTSDIRAGHDGNVKFRYSRQHDSLTQNLYIIYDDSLIHKSTSGEGFVNYDFQVRSLSICNELNDKLIMGFESDFIDRPNRIFFPKRSKFNLNVSLIKKGNSVFIIVIHSRAVDFKVDRQVLRDLFKDEIVTTWQ